ncbi:DUF2058 family protein [bacterium]|nr:DUF2058 family protein [bacterium]
MGSLRDQLLKAGLVDPKQVKKARHEERQKRKNEGVRQLEHEKKLKEQEWQDRQSQQKADQQHQASVQQQVLQDQQAEHQVRNLIKTSTIGPHWAGNKRFYFTTRNNTISYLAVSEPVAAKLERGEIAIVEAFSDEQDSYVPISAQGARRLGELESDRIRFFNTK